MKRQSIEQPLESQPSRCTLLDYAWLAFCCAGAAVITAILHSRRCLWFDELTTVLTAQRPFLEGLLQLEDYSAPIYQLLMRLVAPNGWPSETVLRTPAFLSAFLGLVSTWWLAKSLFNKRVAAFAAFIVAFNPVFLAYATEGRPYSVFLFLSVLSIATYHQALRRPGRAILCLYVLSSVLLVYSHYFGFLVLCAEAVFFLATVVFRPESRSSAGRVLIAALIIAVAALPALWLSSRYVFAGLAGLRSNVPRVGYRALFLADIGGLIFDSPALSVLFFWAVAASVWVFVSPARWADALTGSPQPFSRTGRWGLMLCLVWFACSCYFLIVISVFVKPILSPRYVVPAMVPCAILLSAVASTMPRSVRVLVLLLTAAGYYPQVKSYIKEKRSDYPDLTIALRQANPEKSRVYVTGCADYEHYRSALEVGLRYYGYDEPNIAVLNLAWDDGQYGYLVREPDPLKTAKRCFVVSHWPGYEKPVDESLQRLSRKYEKHQYGSLTLFQVHE
jgi:hypothetical protein